MHIMAVENAVWSAACHTSAWVNRARLFTEHCEIPQEGGRKKEEQLSLMEQHRSEPANGKSQTETDLQQ